jgi:hypothetical protein
MHGGQLYYSGPLDLSPIRYNMSVFVAEDPMAPAWKVGDVASASARACVERGRTQLLRICACGYEGVCLEVVPNTPAFDCGLVLVAPTV